MTLNYARWTKNGTDRLYIKEATGFKNRPFQEIGYIDLTNSEIVPAKGQHVGSVEQYIQRDGKTVAGLIAEYKAQQPVEAPNKDSEIIQELKEHGYNAGAAAYIVKAINQGGLTLAKALSASYEPSKLAAINAKYGSK